MNIKTLHDFVGEFVGTFLLVFIGCSTVAVSVLFNAHTGLFQIALMWGLGVTLAIYATRHLSCAHLNPAVSLAMVVGGRMRKRKLIEYWSAQFLGAFLAAAVLYGIFSGMISQFETLNGIVRGTPDSIQTAMIFGEFYPNPGIQDNFTFTHSGAFAVEALGTFLLVFMVFSLTEGCNLGRPDDNLAPFFIGLTVTVIIGIMAPLTQVGINSARDLSPRIFAYIAGWGNAALPDKQYGFLTVYVLAPLVGGTIAALMFTKIIEPLMLKKQNTC